jgi:2-(1,2-epoxy-1,2-dihydrophenyl)acetyl-CoA isomerase
MGPVASSREGSVVTVCISRPEQANSLTVEAKQALLGHLREAAGDPGVRAVVLTGEGRAFCAGQDLAEHARALDEGAAQAFETVPAHYAPAVRLLAGMPKPVVAAVNGSCAGAGLGLALACDLRVAAEGARFATAFTGIGLAADSGLSATLARAVGWSRAMGMLMLGEVLDATEALRAGLVHEVVPGAQLASHVAALAARLASGPTRAFAALKKAMWASASMSLDEVLALEGELQAALATTADHRNAVDAFLQKRAPRFEGR